MCIPTEEYVSFLVKLYRFCIVYTFPPAKILFTILSRTVSEKNITILQYLERCAAVFKISLSSYFPVGEDVTASIRLCPVPALYNNKFKCKCFFCFKRRSALGILALSWLNFSSVVLVRRHNRSSKYELVVEEANFKHATPQYAFVCFKNGHKSTVSLRNIAPLPDTEELIPSNTSNNTVINVETNDETSTKENNKETDIDIITEKILMLKGYKRYQL